MAPLLTLHVCLLLYANKTAYQTRNVRSDYQESTWVALSMVSQFQILVLAIPVLIMVAKDPITSFFLRVCVIFLNDAGVLLLIFVPKLRRFYDVREVTPYGDSNGTAATSRTAATSNTTGGGGFDLQAELDAANGEISTLREQVVGLKEKLAAAGGGDAILEFEKPSVRVESLTSPR